MYKPEYLFGKVVPEIGTTFEVAPGVFWLRMPLPFALNHINLWLLEDGDGWTVVDTGIARDEVKAAWSLIDPIIENWVNNKEKIHQYTAGTSDPKESEVIFENQNQFWRKGN